MADNPITQARCMRRIHYRNKYGCTVADYDFLLHLQHGCCAICGRAEKIEGSKHLDFDHDHSTGKARGLLCNRCNVLVGYGEHLRISDPDLLLRVDSYLSGRVELLEF